MSQNLETLAMLDIAEIILKDSSEPLNIKEIIEKVLEIKGISQDDFERATQLYMDITQSAKFVFCGEEKWDLKERNLELWDKDGYAFAKFEEVEVEDDDTEDEEELEFTEFNLEDIEEEVEEEAEEEIEEEVDEEEKEALKEEQAYIEVELPAKSTDDDSEDDVDIEFNDYDEDDYNEIMDDYEDMYDK